MLLFLFVLLCTVNVRDGDDDAADDDDDDDDDVQWSCSTVESVPRQHPDSSPSALHQVPRQ